MTTMRFDYRDLFRAPRIAFSFQRLWIQFLGILAGYGGYVVLTYLAFLVAGANLGVAWSSYGLIPCPIDVPLPWYSKILFALGIVFLVYVCLVTSTAVARAAYMHLKGNNFYTWKEAVRFALKKKGGAVAATPVAILAILFFVALGGAVVGLFGRIPWGIGDVLGVGISLLTPLWYAASLFLVFLALALCVSIWLTPAVLATTDDDAFEGIFQSFSTLASQPWRLIVYGVTIKVLSLAGLLVLAFFAKHAWIVMTRVLAFGMGEKWADISYAATYQLQNWIYPAIDWLRALPANLPCASFIPQEIIGAELPVVASISAVVTAIFLVLIGTAILAYPLAIFNTGSTLLFLALKKKKDDENLLERKDKEEETEEEGEKEPESADATGLEEEKKPSRTRKPAARPKSRAARRTPRKK
jgi:hypothetical protein